MGKYLLGFLRRGFGSFVIFKGVSPNQLATMFGGLIFGLVGKLVCVLEALSIPQSDLGFKWNCKGNNNSKPESEEDLVKGLEVSRVIGPSL